MNSGSKRPHAFIELRPGVEIQVDLDPRPNFRGELVLVVPPWDDIERLHDAGVLDRFLVAAGAANVLHVRVERKRRKAAAKPAPAKAASSAKRPRRPRAAPAPAPAPGPRSRARRTRDPGADGASGRRPPT